MSSPHITLDMGDGVAKLTLNRPEVHNVVNEAMLVQWEQAMDRITGGPDIHAIILTGAGDKTFCAGGDLRWFTHLREPDEVRAMSERMQGLLNRLYEGDLPVIGMIKGSAYGGGCEILTACHFVIAADDVFFQFRQSAMGVVTGWGGGLRLMRRVGRAGALELLLGGARIDAERALDMGLIDRMTSRSALEKEAHDFAALIAQRSPDAIYSFLELARFAECGDTRAIRERETELFVSCWQGPWFRKAVDGFLDKSKKS